MNVSEGTFALDRGRVKGFIVMPAEAGIHGLYQQGTGFPHARE